MKRFQVIVSLLTAVICNCCHEKIRKLHGRIQIDAEKIEID